MRQLHQKRIISGFLIGLVAGALLLLGRPATISQAQGCDPAYDIWVGREIALAGTDMTILKIGD